MSLLDLHLSASVNGTEVVMAGAVPMLEQAADIDLVQVGVVNPVGLREGRHCLLITIIDRNHPARDRTGAAAAHVADIQVGDSRTDHCALRRPPQGEHAASPAEVIECWPTIATSPAGDVLQRSVTSDTAVWASVGTCGDDGGGLLVHDGIHRVGAGVVLPPAEVTALGSLPPGLWHLVVLREMRGMSSVQISLPVISK